MTQTTITPYERMGGEKAILGLVNRFYFYMDTLQETQEIRIMHAADLTPAKEKLFKFLSGWLGGPDLYMQEFGHPMLRRRHLRFAIGLAERDQWMLCMKKALDDMTLDADLRNALQAALSQLASHMINR